MKRLKFLLFLNVICGLFFIDISCKKSLQENKINKNTINFEWIATILYDDVDHYANSANVITFIVVFDNNTDSIYFIQPSSKSFKLITKDTVKMSSYGLIDNLFIKARCKDTIEFGCIYTESVIDQMENAKLYYKSVDFNAWRNYITYPENFGIDTNQIFKLDPRIIGKSKKYKFYKNNEFPKWFQPHPSSYKTFCCDTCN